MFIFQFYFRRFFFFIHSSNFYNNSNAKIVWFRQFSPLPFNVYGGRNCVYMCDCDSNVTYFSWNFALLPNYDWWCDSWFIDCQQWQICWFVTSFSIWRHRIAFLIPKAAYQKFMHEHGKTATFARTLTLDTHRFYIHLSSIYSICRVDIWQRKKKLRILSDCRIQNKNATWRLVHLTLFTSLPYLLRLNMRKIICITRIAAESFVSLFFICVCAAWHKPTVLLCKWPRSLCSYFM